MDMLLPYIRPDAARTQIRLLRVEANHGSVPDDPSDTAFFDHATVRCSIEVVSLDDDPSFVALSHAFGDPGETTPIAIDGPSISTGGAIQAYTKQVELVVRDALYYVYAVELMYPFCQMLKLHQPRRGILLQRMRSETQCRQDHRAASTAQASTTTDDRGVYSHQGDYTGPTWLPDVTRRNILEGPRVHVAHLRQK
ncbi:uncharacterized protein B0I36DRAFT_364270 [Microdochium trichocladiopsis]|uniref:Uncharacterized protein n=1 Tax=Microdochium trichocladiopsis TaxID=1682393 RepID=A0A9P8Y5P6_9PEZI|nr:uncharacterized protein B0I36DRAFT_364270 [Microdochium trichocladiopsis]KAH7029795.1 hypothetical protein B0I36DRAFT_364270 [Microdochium trichocladiopsis]